VHRLSAAVVSIHWMLGLEVFPGLTAFRSIPGDAAMTAASTPDPSARYGGPSEIARFEPLFTVGERTAPAAFLVGAPDLHAHPDPAEPLVFGPSCEPACSSEVPPD